MLGALLGLALTLGAADHWTTWLCLQGEFGGTRLVEGNPLAAWLFGVLGVPVGLAVDSLVSAAGLVILTRTRRLSYHAKLALLASVTTLSGCGLASNLGVLRAVSQSAAGSV